MDNRLYRYLMLTAIVLTVAWLGWTVYDTFVRTVSPGDHGYHAANKLFEDGHYERALTEYNAALAEAPDHVHALRGKARTLMQLGEHEQALQAFNVAIAREPGFAPSYANRGILYDRMGLYEKAIADYERALQLDIGLAKGPGWLTRFLRLQPQKPPTIADRAAYLREQLARPESERTLRMPEVDEQQRPYKL